MAFVSTFKHWWTTLPWVRDAALVILLLPPSLRAGDPDFVYTGAPSGIATILVVLACLATMGRRRHPIVTLLLTTSFAIAAAANIGHFTAVVAASMIGIYGVSSSHQRSIGVAWLVAAIAAWATWAYLDAGDNPWYRAAFMVTGWSITAWAIGDAVKSKRAYVKSVEERARRAEDSKEQEARRRVIEERVYIARELHDVIAHHIAIVSVQAGAAESLIRTNPNAAEQALAHVRQASRSVLEELSAMLGVLRQPDDERNSTEPAPGLANIDELIDNLVTLGLRVDRQIIGQPVEIGSTVDLIAYRIAQEALTNAHKYGTGTAGITLDYSPSQLTIHVENMIAGVKPAPTDGSGYGIIGMRERAAAVKGSVEAKVENDGSFVVRAVLPFHNGAVRAELQ